MAMLRRAMLASGVQHVALKVVVFEVLALTPCYVTEQASRIIVVW